MARYGFMGNAQIYADNEAVHGPWFKRYAPEGAYEHIDLKACDDGFREAFVRTFAGAQVGLEYQEMVAAQIDRVDPVAAAVGAIDCLWNDHGLVLGFNHLWVGVLRAIASGLGCELPLESYDFSFLAGKQVVVLGSGACARAVAHGIYRGDGDLVVLSEDEDAAQTIAEENNGRCGPPDVFEAVKPEIVICTQPDGQASPSYADMLSAWGAVLAVEVSENTPFLEAARAAGCICVGGAQVLRYTSMESFAVWTGHRPACCGQSEN